MIGARSAPAARRPSIPVRRVENQRGPSRPSQTLWIQPIWSDWSGLFILKSPVP